MAAGAAEHLPGQRRAERVAVVLVEGDHRVARGVLRGGGGCGGQAGDQRQQQQGEAGAHVRPPGRGSGRCGGCGSRAPRTARARRRCPRGPGGTPCRHRAPRPTRGARPSPRAPRPRRRWSGETHTSVMPAQSPSPATRPLATRHAAPRRRETKPTSAGPCSTAAASSGWACARASLASQPGPAVGPHRGRRRGGGQQPAHGTGRLGHRGELELGVGLAGAGGPPAGLLEPVAGRPSRRRPGPRPAGRARRRTRRTRSRRPRRTARRGRRSPSPSWRGR